MTKLMEQWMAKAATLPEETQNALAKRLLNEWDSATPIPRWHIDTLEERLRDEAENPDDYLSLDQLRIELAARRQRK